MQSLLPAVSTSATIRNVYSARGKCSFILLLITVRKPFFSNFPAKSFEVVIETTKQKLLYLNRILRDVSVNIWLCGLSSISYKCCNVTDLNRIHLFQISYSLIILIVFFTQEKKKPLFYIKNRIQHLGIGLFLNVVLFLLK